MRAVYLLAPDGSPGVWTEDGGRTLHAKGEARTYEAKPSLRDELSVWIEDARPTAERITDEGYAALGKRRYDSLARSGWIVGVPFPPSRVPPPAPAAAPAVRLPPHLVEAVPWYCPDCDFVGTKPGGVHACLPTAATDGPGPLFRQGGW